MLVNLNESWLYNINIIIMFFEIKNVRIKIYENYSMLVRSGINGFKDFVF